MKANVQISKVNTAHCAGGESPLWDVKEQALYFIDNTGRKIHRFHPESGLTDSWALPRVITALALREQGGAVISLVEAGIHFFDFDSGKLEPVNGQEAHATHRLNDAKVDRRGRFVVGGSTSQILDPIPDGGLLRLDPDHTLTALDSGIHFSNGPCWSPDSSTLYFSDSWLNTVYAYDYDLESGAVANRRVFVETNDLGGVPDGATVDSDGNYWVAVYGASKVAAFTPDGNLKCEIDMPVELVSSVNFGGPDLQDLYVTSIERRHDRPDDPVPPGAGDLYVIQGLGVRGLPEPRYKG